MTVRDLLLEIQSAGMEVQLDGDRIRLVTGKKRVSPRLELQVQKLEKELLGLLRTESWLVQAPLHVFAQCRVALEVFVPDLPETLWFVSDAEQVDRIVAREVRRGRIWTAEELRELMAAPGMTPEDAVAIVRAKMAFDATVTDVRPDPRSDKPPIAEVQPEQKNLDLGSPPREFD